MLYRVCPVLAPPFSVVALGERPTVHLAVALLGATIAVGLVLGRGSLHLSLSTGEVAALTAALFAALSAILIRGMRGTENAPTIFFFFCLAGLPVVLPFALQRWPSDPVAWAMAIAMALAAAAAQVLMTDAYVALSVAEASVWLQLTPIAQTALAFALLGEPASAASLGGIVLGVAAVAYGTAFGSARREPPLTDPPPS